MEEKTKGTLFLFATGLVGILSSTLPTLYHLDKKLPDPLNVLVILFFGFVPVSVMIWIFLHRFYFPSQRSKDVIKNS